MNRFRIAMLVGVIWGILTWTFYEPIVGQVPLPFIGFLAFTIFLPGMLGCTIIANIFKPSIISDGNVFYAYVPNPYTEAFAAIISVLIGMAIVYVFCLLSK